MTIMNESHSKLRRHAAKIQTLVESVLNSRGDSNPDLRRAVEQRTAAHGGRFPEGGVQLPPEIASYIDKIARHAYKVTDADIKNLRDAGYSEDAIFELTLCAALGAGMARLERGMAAMQGGVVAA
jgi:alkylhydroperoxidase family enzyme